MSVTRTIPYSHRAVTGARQRKAVISTDRVVQVYDKQFKRIMWEVLVTDGVILRDPAPLQLDHNWSVTSTIGSVSEYSREGGSLMATLRFAEGVPQADEAAALVDGGHIRSLSVGYRVLESTEIPPGRTQEVAGRSFTAPRSDPLRIVTRWRLNEVSLVVVPADDAASIRSAHEDITMPPTTTLDVVPAYHFNQMRFADYAEMLLRSRGERIAESRDVNCRSAFEGTSELLSVVSQWVLDAWRSVGDSLAGIERTIDSPNYLENQIAAISVHPRMERLGRGQIAPEISIGAESQGYNLMRFGLQFAIDETDMIDGATIGVLGQAVNEAVRAARSSVSDLKWAVLLGNPDAADSTSLFDASRGNSGTAVLDADSLDAAMGVIAGQTGVGEDGLPVHWNLDPRYLIVPPSLYGDGLKLARDLSVGGRELTVRSESRMSSTGVLDPRDGETLVQGVDTNWLLASPGFQKASIVTALLFGRTEPDVRQFQLKGGRWGFGFDVSFSCAVAAVSGEPLFWSTGAGE